MTIIFDTEFESDILLADALEGEAFPLVEGAGEQGAGGVAQVAGRDEDEGYDEDDDDFFDDVDEDDDDDLFDDDEEDDEDLFDDDEDDEEDDDFFPLDDEDD